MSCLIRRIGTDLHVLYNVVPAILTRLVNAFKWSVILLTSQIGPSKFLTGQTVGQSVKKGNQSKNYQFQRPQLLIEFHWKNSQFFGFFLKFSIKKSQK